LCLRVTSGSILFLTQHFRSFFRIYQNLNIDPSIPLPVHLQQPASQFAWPPARRALDPITQLAFFLSGKAANVRSQCASWWSGISGQTRVSQIYVTSFLMVGPVMQQ